MTTIVSGIAAVVITSVLWTYLRLRVRHAQTGLAFLDEFGELARELSEREMPDRELESLVKLSSIIGTGHVARALFRQLANGQLASPPSRNKVAARRKAWSGYNSATRILYVRTFYAGIRADSYFAGTVVGTLFRRAVFYLNADPAEIAVAIDAMETKILLLGAERAVRRETARHHVADPTDKVLLRA